MKNKYWLLIAINDLNHHMLFYINISLVSCRFQPVISCFRFPLLPTHTNFFSIFFYSTLNLFSIFSSRIGNTELIVSFVLLNVQSVIFHWIHFDVLMKWNRLRFSEKNWYFLWNWKCKKSEQNIYVKEHLFIQWIGLKTLNCKIIPYK